MRNLYMTLTEIDSDFNGKGIRWYTKTIATYSGLSTEWIPKGLKRLARLGAVQFGGKKDESGKWMSREIEFTPDSINLQSTNTGKPVNGKPVNGKSGTLEESSLQEDSPIQEEIVAVTEFSQRTVTDEFQKLYMQANEGKKPTWLPQHFRNLRPIIETHEPAEIIASVRKYFAGNWWFAKNGERAFAPFLQHYDEIASAKPPNDSKSRYEVRPEVLRQLEEFNLG